MKRWFTSPVRPNGTQKWVDFADTFWHVDYVRSMSLNTFTGHYRKWCRQHHYNFSAGKAKDIHAAAKEQIALTPKSPTSKLLIQRAVAQVIGISRMVETLRSEMDHLASQLLEYPVVLSMCGVGEISWASAHRQTWQYLLF